MLRTQITLVGNLGRDPELRQAGDQEVCSLNVAVNRRIKGEDMTDWFSVSVWGKPAKNCADYLHKGSQVIVVGTLEPRVYEKDGVQRTSLDVNAREVHFGAKPENQMSVADAESVAATQKAKAEDEAIPF